MPERLRTALVCFCIAALCGLVALETDSTEPDLGESYTSYEIHSIASGGAILLSAIGVLLLLVWLAKSGSSND